MPTIHRCIGRSRFVQLLPLAFPLHGDRAIAARLEG